MIENDGGPIGTESLLHDGAKPIKLGRRGLASGASAGVLHNRFHCPINIENPRSNQRVPIPGTADKHGSCGKGDRKQPHQPGKALVYCRMPTRCNH